jgi:DNA-binding XRE family transcriptional regulator
MTPAERWGNALAVVIREKGWSIQGTADRIGEQRKTLDHWVHGRNLPTLETANRVAESLDRPSLAKLALEIRTKACPTCARVFVASGRQWNAVYCSQRCIKAMAARRRRATDDAKDNIARIRLKAYMDAIEKHCRSCEPEGICRDAECAIQAAGLSPFRVDKRLAIA